MTIDPREVSSFSVPRLHVLNAYTRQGQVLLSSLLISGLV